MIGPLNHVGIAVPSIEDAAENYRALYGCLLYTSPSPRD